MLERRRASERFTRLGERLAAISQRRLCGRDRELSLFHVALADRSSPFSVFFVHGLGGVGKSALLDHCANGAVAAGVRTVRLDARTIEASPQSFLHAIGDALRLDDGDSPLDRLSTEPAVVLTLDSFDAIAPLEPWLRQTFLPQLPARGVVMIAGRQPPSSEWVADAAVGPIFRALPLRNLSPADSRMLLSDKRVPSEQHEAVLRFTHGHPLALVLVADVIANAGEETPFTPESAPNIVRELLARLIATVPTRSHRKALETSAQARVTTEALLACVIDEGDPHELFEWLRGLSFMEQNADGLFPHDVAREVLDADFRWRDPDGYLESHRRIWRHLRQRLLNTSGRAQQRVFFDKLFLHRGNATGGRFHDYMTLGSVFAQTATASDRATIVDTVRKCEGEESTHIAEYWLDRQPEAFQIARGPRDEMLGFVATLLLREELVEDAEEDPAVRGAWSFARRGRLRAGEEMVHHRFHMSREGYQRVSAHINLLAMRATFAPIECRRLAWSFVCFAGPEAPWLPLMRYVNFQRAAEADYTIGGRHYVVFAHDWRVEPFEAWWDQLAERSISTEAVGEDTAIPSAPPIVVLAQAEFATCVRQALRDYTRPAALAGNPLVRSRLASDADGSHADAARLQQALRDAIDSLKPSPKDEKFYRALLYTFFQPAITQEAAAERLGLPFSTYRYHLARGTDRVIEWLWEREISGGREG
jgi:hypothetical protein